MRNRILGHKIVRAGDLVPHELNPRVHTQDQKDALASIIKEVGFSRSVLAYQLPDGRLKLIDGHLRTSEMDPDEDIEVEVLDVTDEEARKLLLTIDPLASLANYNDSQLMLLRDVTKADDDILNALWSSLHQEEPKQITEAKKDKREPTLTAQWLIIIDCLNETEQHRILHECQLKGFTCKAVTS
jgi:hypothetical protein